MDQVVKASPVFMVFDYTDKKFNKEKLKVDPNQKIFVQNIN